MNHNKNKSQWIANMDYYFVVGFGIFFIATIIFAILIETNQGDLRFLLVDITKLTTKKSIKQNEKIEKQ